MKILIHDVLQYGFMSKDIASLEASCHKWADAFGAGPFFVIEHHIPDDCTYKGKPCDLDMTYAFGQAGSAQIEFMVQHNDGPSTFRDMFKPEEEGFHHWCIFTNKYDEEYKRLTGNGYIETTAFTTSARVCWLDAEKDLGGHIELYEENPGTQGFFDLLRESHESWDGKDPIRPAPF